MKTSRTLLPALVMSGLLTLAGSLRAQVSFTGETYQQNFDSLPLYTGTETANFSFNNNSTLTGWYTSVTSNTGRSSAGAASTSGQIFNWGVSGSTDRALGLFSGAPEGYASTAYLGVQLQNTHGATIDTLTLTFDVEQWRRNTNAVAWDFSYQVTSSSGNQLVAAGYTADARGDAASSVTGSSSGLNGNAAANVTTVSVTLTGLNWQAGDDLWLRWVSDQGGTSAAIALDNVSVSLSTIPEPQTTAGLLGAAVFVASLFRRKRAWTVLHPGRVS